jgi:hypothetical protein
VDRYGLKRRQTMAATTSGCPIALKPPLSHARDAVDAG